MRKEQSNKEKTIAVLKNKSLKKQKEELRQGYKDLQEKNEKDWEHILNQWIDPKDLGLVARKTREFLNSANNINKRIQEFEERLDIIESMLKQRYEQIMNLFGIVNVSEFLFKQNAKNLKSAVLNFIALSQNKRRMSKKETIEIQSTINKLYEFLASKIFIGKSANYLKINREQSGYAFGLVWASHLYEIQTDVPLEARFNARNIVFIKHLSDKYPGILMSKNAKKQDVVIIKTNNNGQCLYKDGSVIPDADICNSADRCMHNEGDLNKQADIIAMNGELKSLNQDFDPIKLLDTNIIFQAKEKTDIDFFAFYSQKFDNFDLYYSNIICSLDENVLDTFNSLRKWFLEYNELLTKISIEYTYDTNANKKNKQNPSTSLYIPLWCLYNTNGWDSKTSYNVWSNDKMSFVQSLSFCASNNLLANKEIEQEYKKLLQNTFIKRLTDFVKNKLKVFKENKIIFEDKIQSLKNKVPNDVLQIKKYEQGLKWLKTTIKDLLNRFIDLTLNNNFNELSETLKNTIIEEIDNTNIPNKTDENSTTQASTKRKR